MFEFVKILVLLWSVNLAPPILAHSSKAMERARRRRNGSRGRRIPLRDAQDPARRFGRRVDRPSPCAAPGNGLVGRPPRRVPSAWPATSSQLLQTTAALLQRQRGPRPDQCFEGYFPSPSSAVLFPFHLGGVRPARPVLPGAYGGSWFLKSVLMMKPFEDYPRAVRTRTRLREFRSCQINSRPLHHLVNFETAIYYHVFMRRSSGSSGSTKRGSPTPSRSTRATFPSISRTFPNPSTATKCSSSPTCT